MNVPASEPPKAGLYRFAFYFIYKDITTKYERIWLHEHLPITRIRKTLTQRKTQTQTFDLQIWINDG